MNDRAGHRNRISVGDTTLQTKINRWLGKKNALNKVKKRLVLLKNKGETACRARDDLIDTMR